MATEISTTPYTDDQLFISRRGMLGFFAQRASFGVERGTGQQSVEILVLLQSQILCTRKKYAQNHFL